MRGFWKRLEFPWQMGRAIKKKNRQARPNLQTADTAGLAEAEEERRKAARLAEEAGYQTQRSQWNKGPGTDRYGDWEKRASPRIV